MKAQKWSPVKRVLLVQLGFSTLAAGGALWIDMVAAYSALLGGLVSAAANAYAGWRVFSAGAGASEHAELANMYRAEFGKLLMFAALSAAVFAGLREVNIVAFIGGCAASMIAGAVCLASAPVDVGRLRRDDTTKRP